MKACQACEHWRRGNRLHIGGSQWGWMGEGEWGACYGVPPIADQTEHGGGQTFPSMHEGDRCPNWQTKEET